MKISWKSYYKPTPKNIRKIADAFLAAMPFLTGYEIVKENHVLAIAIVFIGALAKILSNFFAE